MHCWCNFPVMLSPGDLRGHPGYAGMAVVWEYLSKSQMKRLGALSTTEIEDVWIDGSRPVYLLELKKKKTSCTYTRTDIAFNLK